jgi:antirestriction protein ArdC
MLESGVPPWRKPWSAGSLPGGFVRPLRVGGQPYRGVNTVNLWAASQIKGYASPYWLTYKGAQEVGAQVRKGERSELAFFVGRQTKSTTNDAGEDVEDSFSFLKAYNVFNAEQIDGLPAKYLARSSPVPFDASKRHARADAFIAHSGATIC